MIIYGPEINLQLEAGYIYADCMSLQLLSRGQAADHTL